ncbi:ketoacyl-ACP synthase III [Faecalicatena sp. AGMB00832]|uniref:Beta-ketoacyl-[acyl-carrier-protein] synthase III n=1 Tax=Faecalicatena faecalis TaxID=2726362 RepID=A0ABS6CYZ3_9FIRM|nr:MULTISPECIES: beta-ketoacyl-ACP synthase III [Faecalicatena]MBU3874360.1 ketoacyl-ACP synthase III [Faecalicatena faecalis]MCI6464517.1 ketoacyl-ACP synthase III [Faecalicatena sp.]MDY5619079.1 beta-ketoacyl-ACP synthase III [Lachnospiraceae bacterium]
MIGKICGTGSYVPAHFLDNNDLSKMVDTNDEWIRERTGVVRRHIIEEETTVSMSVEAARRALENSDTAPEELDLILVSTFTSEVMLPCTACEVQKELGAVNATGFDLNAACTGFLFAYNTAQAYIASGVYKTILLIGAESLSNTVNWEDRGTCILFGDGAGAAVLKAEEGTFYQPVTHSDGSLGDALTCMSRHRKYRPAEEEDLDSYMHMNGQAVFKFAVRRVPEVIGEALEGTGFSVSDIDYFILHQANKRIVESVAKRLKAEIGKFPMNLQEYGNTSSASIPILLDEVNRKGMLKKGDKLVMAGFGAGLSWGAVCLEW